MSMPDSERIADMVSKLLNDVTSARPAQTGQVYGMLLLRFLELGLYDACPDDGSLFAASLNAELARLGRHHGGSTAWQLARVSFIMPEEADAPPKPGTSVH